MLTRKDPALAGGGRGGVLGRVQGRDLRGDGEVSEVGEAGGAAPAHPGVEAVRVNSDTPNDVRSVEITEVIIVVVVRGTGTTEDPLREVHQVWARSGDYIAENDPALSGQVRKRHAAARPTENG